MRYFLIGLLCITLPFKAQSKKVKYLKIDFLHIVLVKDHDSLVNDSTELATMRTYYMKGFLSGKIEDYHYADTIIKIFMANQSFFIGLDVDDIERLIGNVANRSKYMSSYRMARFDMKAPIEKTVLYFRFKNFRLYNFEAPYNTNCCHDKLPKKKIWHIFSKRKPPVYSED